MWEAVEVKRDFTHRGIHRRGVLTGAALISAAVCQSGGGRAAAAPTSVRSTTSADGIMHVPAHDVPMPTTISEQARGYLIALATRPLPPDFADKGDIVAAVRDMSAGYNKAIGDMMAIGAAASRTKVEIQTMGGVPVFVASRSEATTADLARICLNLHGGAFVFGGGRSAMYDAQLLARSRGGLVIGVDYRMAPDHPFPAAPDDCMAVYRAIIERHGPSRLLVSGGSAGGNLAAALMHKARDVGLPPPAALVLDSPVTDLSTTGDSRNTNAYADVVLRTGDSKTIERFVRLYVGNADVSNPYLSPIRGELSQGFPPTYLRSGTRDLLLSDTVRLHAALREAGIEADLYIGESAPHGGFPPPTPEAAKAAADLERWLDGHWRK